MVTSAVQTIPDRTLAQRMSALEKANEIRIYRAALKREIAAGLVDAAGKLTDNDPMLETMKVHELLMAMPGTGRVKVNRILTREQVSPSKTIGGLSARQRGALVTALGTLPRCKGRTRAATRTLRLVAS